VQKQVENDIQAFENVVADFRRTEAREFESLGFDYNLSPLPELNDGAQQGSRKNTQQRRETTKTSC
jgi:hypothetical protein